MAKFKAQSPAQIQPQIWGPEPCLDSSHKMAKFEAQRLVQTQPQNDNLKGPEPCLDSAPLSRFSPKMAIALPRFSPKMAKFEAQSLAQIQPQNSNLKDPEPVQIQPQSCQIWGPEPCPDSAQKFSSKIAKFAGPEPCPDSMSKIVKFEAPRGLPKKERGAGWGGLSQNPLRKGCPGSLERGPGAKKKPLRKGQKGLLGEEGRLRKS